MRAQVACGFHRHVTFIPVSVAEFILYSRPAGSVTTTNTLISGEVTELHTDRLKADFAFYEEGGDGRPWAVMRNVTFAKVRVPRRVSPAVCAAPWRRLRRAIFPLFVAPWGFRVPGVCPPSMLLLFLVPFRFGSWFPLLRACSLSSAPRFLGSPGFPVPPSRVPATVPVPVF